MSPTRENGVSVASGLQEGLERRLLPPQKETEWNVAWGRRKRGSA